VPSAFDVIVLPNRSRERERKNKRERQNEGTRDRPFPANENREPGRSSCLLPLSSTYNERAFPQRFYLLLFRVFLPSAPASFLSLAGVCKRFGNDRATACAFRKFNSVDKIAASKSRCYYVQWSAAGDSDREKERERERRVTRNFPQRRTDSSPPPAV